MLRVRSFFLHGGVAMTPPPKRRTGSKSPLSGETFVLITTSGNILINSFSTLSVSRGCCGAPTARKRFITLYTYQRVAPMEPVGFLEVCWIALAW